MTDSHADSLPSGVSPRYEVKQLLGEGGMGRVYKTQDLTLQREVAVKVLVGHSTKDLTRFQREAKSMSRLKHSNLVEVYDFGVTDSGNAYLVMELVSGIKLSQLLERRTRLSIEETVQITLSVADGMFHAHNKGIVHRDLKPSNISIMDENDLTQIKVLDFGISTALDDTMTDRLTQAGAIVGTPLYMSPEQARGETVDQRSDLYSLGCIIYACLSGRPPFQGMSALDTVQMHINAQPKSLRLHSESSVPDAIDAIVMKLLEKKAHDRYQSMADLAEALVAVSNDKQKSISQNPHVAHIRKERSTKSLLRIAGMALLLVGVLGVMVRGFSSTEVKTKTNEKEVSPIQHKQNVVTDYEGTSHSNLTRIDDGIYGDEALTTELATKLSSILLTPSMLAKLPKDDVKSLSLHHSKFADGTLEEMASFPNLRRLLLFNNSVKPSNVLALNKMKSLEQLRINSIDLTSEELEKLKSLTELKLLNLQKCGIDDDAIPLIARNFPNLEVLDLGRTLVREPNFAELQRLTKLRDLSIDELDLTDDVLSTVKGFKNLERVCIDGNNQLTEKGLRRLLSNNPGLMKIEMNNCSALVEPALREKLGKEFSKVQFVASDNKGLSKYQNKYEKSGSGSLDSVVDMIGQ